MNQTRSRVVALVFLLFLSMTRTAVAGPRNGRDSISGPGDRILRIVKKVKIFVRGLTTQDEWTPPLPKP